MKSLLSLILGLLFLSSHSYAQLDSSADSYKTEMGDLTIYPINHGTVAFTFDDKTIFVDPYGGAEKFEFFKAPDIILITDIHGDHLNQQTLGQLDISNTTFIVPQAVADRLEGVKKSQILVLNNGETTDEVSFQVTAIPMYNLPDDENSRHRKGRGNGYVINFGGKHVYLSGDTEDIPEMRALENIDIAFVCMNLPYTMDIYQAASAVLEFKPAILYPYHHRGQDINRFKEIVTEADSGINVVLKQWYSK
ncbi:MBL fold metallo-hydrolase [Balneola vulgaris]|uniref:MBL fold metallo-hydrolase n=1 Tax=Balneola vulgaris TaxID=287535 RepID=UPI0003824D67|nr:MBL fold metallo-hydrolase [Balneola vulgaris]